MRTITISKINDTTFVKVESSGITKTYSSNLGRSLQTYNDGVIILPHDQEGELNNFRIPLSELTDKFGATNPEELHEAIRTNGFFKKSGSNTTSGSATLETSKTASIEVGGTPVGFEFPAGMTFDQYVSAIHEKYIPGSFSSFNINASLTNPVVGQQITFSIASFGYSPDSNGNNPVDVMVNGLGFNLQVPLDDTSLSITEQSVSKNTGNLTETWSLTGNDGEANAISPRFYTVRWFNQFLFGASDQEIDGANAQTLLSGLSKTKLNSKSITSTANSDNNNASKYTYVAYDAAYGDLSNAIQNGALPVLSAFTKVGDFSWVNDYGVTITKRVYKSNAQGAFADGTTIQFS